MSKERLNREIGKYKQQIQNHEITQEQLLDQIREICYAKPKIPEADFLAVVRQYDANFAPIASDAERTKRAALSQQAQDIILQTAMKIETSNIHPDVQVPTEPGTITRHHHIMFRCLSQDEQQQMADMLYKGTPEEKGRYYYNRLGARKQEFLNLLDMSDEDLVKNYAKYADDLLLISELQAVMAEAVFTPEQEQDMVFLKDNMARFTTLGMRVDLIANPYYANYPCEQLNLSAEKAVLFAQDMINLAVAHGEPLSNESQANYLSGPSEMLGLDYRGLQTFTLQATIFQVTEYVKSFGVSSEKVTWANPPGSIANEDLAVDSLFERRPVFVNIPGVGVKALCNTATNPRDCRVEEASDAVLSQYMKGVTGKVRSRADQANPFFLSVFTGSKQYDRMLKHMKEAEKALQKLEYPLDPESEAVRKVIGSIEELGKAQKAYLAHKESQGLQRDEGSGRLIGRTENERNRLAVARDAEALYNTLKFQLRYQLNPEAAADHMEKELEKIEQQRKAKENARRAEEKARQAEAEKRANAAAKQVPVTLVEEELSKSTKADLVEAGGAPYKNIPVCKVSDAGDGLAKLQKEVSDVIPTLAAHAARNKPISESFQKAVSEGMAKMVLFNYVLRERMANGQAGENIENIKAGMAETALKEGANAVAVKVANTKEFKELIGKVTPARLEAFLKNNEARSKDFDGIVQNVLSPVKVNAVSNQVAPQQPKVELEQPKAEAKPMVPGV